MGLITVSEDGNTLVLGLPKELSTDNAKEAKDELVNILETKSQEKIEFDANDTTYISSAGIRNFIYISKLGYKFEIKNVSDEIYDIFDVTGLTKVIVIRKKMKEVSIENLECIGRGATAKVYRLDKDKIIKVFSKDLPLAAVQRELEKSKETFLKGINTPVSYDIVKVKDSYGTIYELINAKTLSEELDENPTEEDRLIKEYVDFFKDMDSIELDRENFISTKDYYVSSMTKYRQGTEDAVFESMISLIKEVPDADYFVHSDFHPKNVMYADKEPTLIDMGGTTRGHHIFELIGVGTLIIQAERMPDDIIYLFTGMHTSQLNRVWRKFFDYYFEDKPDEIKEKIEKVILCYSAIRGWLICSVISELPKSLLDYNIKVFEKHKKETEECREAILNILGN